MKIEDNPVSVKYYVKKYLIRNQRKFKNRVVIDFPAGNGVTSKIIGDIGGIALPFDLFPQYFKCDNMNCGYANINESIPVADKHADAVICQEGLEHFSDQLKALKEFNRVLKPGGTLIVTTPNYSDLESKLSYFLAENEKFNSGMPPNEIDSVWINPMKNDGEMYYGHIFLTGIQKLRILAKLSGFKIKKVHFTRVKYFALLLLIIFYPIILLTNAIMLFRNLRKKKEIDYEVKKKIYMEVFRLSVNPKILIDFNLFVEFEKENDCGRVADSFKGVFNEFGST
jgi:SAM-dependent methyltransferase